MQFFVQKIQNLKVFPNKNVICLIEIRILNIKCTIGTGNSYIKVPLFSMPAYCYVSAIFHSRKRCGAHFTIDCRLSIIYN